MLKLNLTVYLENQGDDGVVPLFQHVVWVKKTFNGIYHFLFKNGLVFLDEERFHPIRARVLLGFMEKIVVLVSTSSVNLVRLSFT